VAPKESAACASPRHQICADVAAFHYAAADELLIAGDA
jgi:hypothetical protein